MNLTIDVSSGLGDIYVYFEKGNFAVGTGHMAVSSTLIADKFDISTTYLSKVFKKQTGESLLAYINRLRLEEAKCMLRETNRTVETIAKEVGYSNSLALIRAFKKNIGVTPTEYKNMNK